MRVLVVDDESDARDVVARALRADGHAITVASDLAGARERLVGGTDLVVLDLRLPDGLGLEFCRELRREGSRVPILLLTALSEVSFRVQGLNSGADDYLAKPFAVAELRARVRALGRRAGQRSVIIFRWGDVELDFPGRRALRAGQVVAVTSREWAILDMLAARRGRVLSRDELLEGVWGRADDSSSGSLEVLVARLRRKLGRELIRTLRGEGYALAESDPDVTYR